MRLTVLLLALAALAGCTTTFEGDKPSNLYGQHLDSAVALYGRWDEQFELDGKTYFLWRRRVTMDDGDRYCELRLEVNDKRQIARRQMQGYPAACDLFVARFTPTKR